VHNQCKFYLSILIVLDVVGISAPRLSGQDYSTEIGKPTFTSAETIELGYINLANGNLHLEIPLGKLFNVFFVEKRKVALKVC